MNNRAPVLLLISLVSPPAATAQLGISLTNGQNTYIEAPYDKTLVPQTGFTVEAWITYDGSTLSAGTKWPTIIRHNIQPNAESYVFRVDAGSTQNRSIKLAVRTTTGGFQQAGYTFALGELKAWTHVAGTFDGSFIRFYVNGVERGTYTFNAPTTVSDTGGVLRIGCGDTSTIGAETWNGELDEVRLWPYARTADEILSTMNYALSSVEGEVSTWNLDFTPNDSSGKNNGTNVGNVSYGPNSLRLTMRAWTSTSYGTATASCTATPLMNANGIAIIGNSAYALNAIRGPRAGRGVVFVLLGLARLANPIQIGASAVWVDPTVSLLVTGQTPYDRYSRLALPIPNQPNLPGTSVFAQMAFGTGCVITPFATQALEVKFVR